MFPYLVDVAVLPVLLRQLGEAGPIFALRLGDRRSTAESHLAVFAVLALKYR